MIHERGYRAAEGLWPSSCGSVANRLTANCVGSIAAAIHFGSTTIVGAGREVRWGTLKHLTSAL